MTRARRPAEKEIPRVRWREWEASSASLRRETSPPNPANSAVLRSSEPDEGKSLLSRESWV